VDGLLVVGGWRDELLDARDQNRAVGRDEAAHECDEVRHRLVDRAPEHARVQVSRGARDGHLEVREPAQAVCQARRARVQPVVVALGARSAACARARGEGWTLTMQMQSTPENQPFARFASANTNSSRPSDPHSSMPSKQKRRLTGSASPCAWCASSTFSQPRIGPLSSVDPVHRSQYVRP
jgi:hypothetical protein